MARTTWKSTHGNDAVDRIPRCYGLKRRHIVSILIRATAGRPRVAAGTARHTCYGPAGRRSGSVRVGAAAGTA